MRHLISWYHKGFSDTATTAVSGWDRLADGAGYVRRRDEAQIFEPTSPQPLDTVPLCRWYSPMRHDRFTTSDPGWRGRPGDTRSPDYVFEALEGYVFETPRADTVALYAWHNSELHDNLLTSDPAWRGAPGDTRDGYRFIRIEGFANRVVATSRSELELLGAPAGAMRGRMPLLVIIADLADRAVRFHDLHFDQLVFGSGTRSDAGTVTACRWYSPGRADYFLTTDPAWAGTQDSQLRLDYQFVRVEGFVRPFVRDATPPRMRVLHRWWDGAQKDNFTTSDPAWAGMPGAVSGAYAYSSPEGFVFSPASPQPPGTAMLHRWRSSPRGDEFTTADPVWRGRAGDVRDGYRYVQPEGFVNTSQAAGMVPLCHWFSQSRGDNLLQATSPFVVDVRSPDYVLQSPECRFFDPAAAPPAGTVPLHMWFHVASNHHLLTSDPAFADPSRPAAGYRHVRLEGFVFDAARPQPAGTVPLLRWEHSDGLQQLTTSDPAFGVARPPSREWRLARREGYALPPRQIAESTTGTFSAISRSVFTFSRVGVVRIQLPQTVAHVIGGDESFLNELDASSVRRAAESIDLRPLATDGQVRPHDLTVVRVFPTAIDGEAGRGQARGIAAVEATGLRIQPHYAACDETGDINLINHELFHTLGFNSHIYGPGAGVNVQASLFAASFSFPGPGTIHLDPWHRLRAGWVRPNVGYIGEAGTSVRLSDGASLLYDPRRGTREFFLVEFRAPGVGGPPWFDAGVVGRGVMVWYVQTLAGGDLVAFGWPPPFSSPVAGGRMFANYLVAPDGTFGGPPLWTDTTGSTVVQLPWGDGTASGAFLAVRVETASAWVEWRPSASPLAPRLDSVTPGIRAGRESEAALAGSFPIAGARSTLRRMVDARAWDLRVIDQTPRLVRVVVPSVPAGLYEFSVAALPAGAASPSSNRIAYTVS